MRALLRTGLMWVSLLTLDPAWAADVNRGVDAVVQRDWEAALAEFRPLAEQGDAAAQVNLGNLYLKGYGVEQDYRAALRWYLKAAEQGNALGQGKLGMMHYYGFGVLEDHTEAAHWFREAAEQGEPGAAALLGALYAAGDGVDLDKVQAYVWYTLAADRGRADAQEGKQDLAEELSPGEMNDALERLADWSRRHPPVVVEETETVSDEAPVARVPHHRAKHALADSHKAKKPKRDQAEKGKQRKSKKS